MKTEKPILLGVTGGIATGKSVVSAMLSESGYPLIDFDILSRIVVEPEKSAWEKIVSFLGTSVLNNDKTINRNKLREIIFADAEKRKKLESFIHPEIKLEFGKLIAEYTKKNYKIVQAGVPLLIEAALQRDFDYILLVYAPPKEQITRLIKRDKISYGLALKIIKSQMPIDEKKKYADFIIDNSGTIEDTRKEAAKFCEKIQSVLKETPV